MCPGLCWGSGPCVAAGAAGMQRCWAPAYRRNSRTYTASGPMKRQQQTPVRQKRQTAADRQGTSVRGKFRASCGWCGPELSNTPHACACNGAVYCWMTQKHIAADAGMCAAQATTKTVLFWILLVTHGLAAEVSWRRATTHIAKQAMLKMKAVPSCG
jgi:hypothetical protein